MRINRHENSVEHSWQACISTLVLKDYANEKINIHRVIKILLIHDLCEINTDGTIVYKSNSEEAKTKEAHDLKRLLDIPANTDNYLQL